MGLFGLVDIDHLDLVAFRAVRIGLVGKVFVGLNLTNHRHNGLGDAHPSRYTLIDFFDVVGFNQSGLQTVNDRVFESVVYALPTARPIPLGSPDKATVFLDRHVKGGLCPSRTSRGRGFWFR